MYMYFWPILTHVLMVMFHVLLGCDPPNMAMSPVNRLTRTNNKHKLQWSIRYLHRVTTFQSTENGKQTAMLVLFAISHGYWHTIWGTNRGAVHLPRCSFQSPFFETCFVSCSLSPPKVCFPLLSPFAKLVGPHRKSERRKGRRSILRKSPKETDVFSFAGNIIYKWWIFHCHVWLPEGKPRNEKTWWFSVGFLWDYIGLIGIIPALRCLVILPFNALWRVEIQL